MSSQFFETIIQAASEIFQYEMIIGLFCPIKTQAAGLVQQIDQSRNASDLQVIAIKSC